MTPEQQQQIANLTRAAAAVPAEVRGLIGRQAIASQRSEEHWPYFSRIRFRATIAAGPPVVYSFPLGLTSRAFSYGIGQDMSPAGFAPGTLATEADTNLVEANKTKDGQELEIVGVSCFIVPTSDPTMTAFIFKDASAKFTRAGGDEAQKIGSLMFIPSSGGLTGQGISYGTQANKSSNHVPYGFVSNGLPVFGSYYKLPAPVYWSPSGSTDSTLNLEVALQRAITLPNLTPRALGLSTDFQDLFAPPTTVDAPYTYVELIMQLFSRQTQGRSKNR